MVATRYSEQQGPQSRQKVMRHYNKHCHRPKKSKWFLIKPPPYCMISRATSIDSNCCRLPTASVLSNINSTTLLLLFYCEECCVYNYYKIAHNVRAIRPYAILPIISPSMLPALLLVSRHCKQGGINQRDTVYVCVSSILLSLNDNNTRLPHHRSA